MEEPCASEDRERLLRPAPPASSFPRCSDRREMAVEMSQMPLADVAEAERAARRISSGTGVARGRTGRINGFTRVCGHPLGLFTLAGVECWERFSYYGQRAELILYMNDEMFMPGQWQRVLGHQLIDFAYGIPADSMEPGERAAAVRVLASRLYGTYVALCYLSPLLGGWLADRYFGLFTMLFAGCVCITLGHALMVFPSNTLLALLMISLGTGFFKPNASTLVGRLYSPTEASLRDSGFSIFYCAINVGAFFAPLVCGTLRHVHGYETAFGAAGLGMALALAMFVVSHRLQLYAPAAALDLSLSTGAPHEHLGPQRCSTSAAVGRQQPSRTRPSIGLLRAHAREVLVVVVACGLSVVFWAVYEQGGNSVVLYVHERVDRSVGGFTIPTEWFQSINPLFVVAFTPVLSTFWRRAESTSAPTTTAASKHTSLMRMGTGSCLLGAAFLLLSVVDASAAGGDVHSLYIVWYVAVLTVGELHASPVGISFISQVAPVQLASIMMGVWFLGSSIGGYAGGLVGGMYAVMPQYAFFASLGVTAVANGCITMALSKPLLRVLRGVAPAG